MFSVYSVFLWKSQENARLAHMILPILHVRKHSTERQVMCPSACSVVQPGFEPGLPSDAPNLTSFLLFNSDYINNKVQEQQFIKLPV